MVTHLKICFGDKKISLMEKAIKIKKILTSRRASWMVR